MDLVLLDLILPGAYGIELLQKIREHDPETNVLIMTGQYSTESAVKAIQAGADDYLNKPVSVQTLRDRVDRWLEEQGRAAAGGPTGTGSSRSINLRRNRAGEPFPVLELLTCKSEADSQT